MLVLDIKQTWDTRTVTILPIRNMDRLLKVILRDLEATLGCPRLVMVNRDLEETVVPDRTMATRTAMDTAEDNTTVTQAPLQVLVPLPLFLSLLRLRSSTIDFLCDSHVLSL